MAFETENFLSRLNVPQLCRVVHGARCDEHAVWVEREADNLHFVALQSVIALSCVRVPNLRLPIEGTCHYLVSVTVNKDIVSKCRERNTPEIDSLMSR